MVPLTTNVSHPRWPRLTRYALALSATLVVLLIRWSLDPVLGASVPYISVFPAIIFSAWYCGPGPSIASVVLALSAENYLFSQPRHSFIIAGATEWVQVAIYLSVAGFIVAMAQINRRTIQQLDAAKTTLETRVRERTAELQRQAAELASKSQLLDLANDGIFATEEGRITYWNRGAERLYGWTAQDALGKEPGELLRSRLPLPREIIVEQVYRAEYWEGDIIQTRRDGAEIVVASRWSVWRDANRKEVGWLEINSDITQRKRAEDSLRELTGRLLRLQDEERRRIARELHDSTGQMLVALAINLSSLNSDPNVSSGRAAQLLADSQQLVQDMTKEVRTLSYLLHPPLLDEAGLNSALRWYVEGFSKRSHVLVNLDLDPSLGRLPRETETAVFRIVQECLTNVHRHSGSAFAQIRLERRPHSIRVEVEDEGKGIPAEKLENPKSSGGLGIGITGMRERVRQLGGRLEIISADSGTLVRADFPLQESAAQAAGSELHDPPRP